MIDIDEKFDLFIAFHGGRENGTLSKAEEIYQYLISKGYNVFIQTISNKNGAYKDTHRIVQHSKLFLFVVNSSIKTIDGLIKTKNSKGERLRIWQEIDSFRECNSNILYPSISSRLYLCDDISSSEYDNYTKLDSLFNGKYCFNKDNFSEIEDWVKTSLSEINKVTDDESSEELHSSNWDSELAKTWHNIEPPSRPSESEIEIYRKYLKLAKNDASYNSHRILILGTTNEFRYLSDSEDFNATIVDSSKEYYVEINTELKKEFKNENIVFCNWLNMTDNEEIIKYKYDVIIGDMAIGNIHPCDLSEFIAQINTLLTENGLFLGKTMFYFNRKTYKLQDVEKLLSKYITDNTDGKFFERSIYPLSILASHENQRISFEAIHKTISNLKKKFPNASESIFDIYLGEKTSFDYKMKLDFYIYPVKRYLCECFRYFHILDIEYGKDYYSNDFPIIVLRKSNNRDKKTIYDLEYIMKQNISYFLVSKKQLTNKWIEALTSQYFLSNVINLLGDSINKDGYTENIQKEITKDIKESMYIKLDDNLNCEMDFYYDEKIIKETLYKYPELKKVLELKNLESDDLDVKQKKEIVELLNNPMTVNYILGVLCYLTCLNPKDDENSANQLVLKRLFSLVTQGSFWEPVESIWVSARICLAILPLYDKLKEDSQKKLINVIEHIIIAYKPKLHYWKEYDRGSKDDTFALCLNVILKAMPVLKLLNNKKIYNNAENVLKDVLNEYILNSNIYDTIQEFFIGESLVNSSRKDIENCRILNDNLSMISALLRLTKYFLEEDPDKYKEQLVESQYLILDVFMTAWENLEDNIEELNEYCEDYESSLVPQLLYSFLNALTDD